MEHVEALIVAPYWPNQPWLCQMFSSAEQQPLIHKPNATNMILPQDPKDKQPLAEKLSLVVEVLSGKL